VQCVVRCSHWDRPRLASSHPVVFGWSAGSGASLPLVLGEILPLAPVNVVRLAWGQLARSRRGNPGPAFVESTASDGARPIEAPVLNPLRRHASDSLHNSSTTVGQALLSGSSPRSDHCPAVAPIVSWGKAAQ
jgi:hypothetical protein